jgi:hypothetical protein
LCIKQNYDNVGRKEKEPFLDGNYLFYRTRGGGPMVIDKCAFGSIVIDGKNYNSDLIIYPDGDIKESWIRKSGHRLAWNDLSGLIESGAEVIIAGTGINGLMKPDKDLEKQLAQKGIRFISARNQRARELYNKMSSNIRVGACFHLTC